MKLETFKKNKPIIMIIVAIILYGIVMCIIFFNLDSDDSSLLQHNYLIINGENFYEYENNQIKTISFSDTNFDDDKFNIYNEGKNRGSFYVAKDGSEYQFIKFFRNKGSDGYIPKLPFIALTQGIEPIIFEKEDLEDNDIENLKKIMLDKEILDIGTLFNSYKINVDIDNDAKEETLYVVSNYDYINISDKMFSIVYVYDDNKEYILEENYYTQDNIDEFIQLDISYILDLDGEKKYTIVVSSSDNNTTIDNFYLKSNSYYRQIRLN